jgi:hypothetical protein
MKEKQICVWEDLFYRGHALAAIEGHEVTPFLSRIFLQDAWSK